MTRTRSNYQREVDLIRAVRSAMQSDAPGLLWSGTSAEESLRRAFFEGQLDLIGWRPSGAAEYEAVQAAGGSAAWSAEEATTEEGARRILYQQQQSSHSNTLGMGLFFSNAVGNNLQISVRYTRVLLESEPYSRHRMVGEAQVVGSPVALEDAPQVIGGSLGLGYEYQAPWLYVGGGVRFVGSAAPDEGTGRLDLSPFAGVGVRAWQTLRVGAEGFVLLPLIEGQEIAVGVGGSVALEF